MSRSPLIRALTARAPRTGRPRRAAAVVLGLFLAFAGTSHLTFARDEFQAQVPNWVPLDKDLVVLLSGVAEIGLGSALALLPSRRVPVGLAAAAFFIAIFPGNISQYVTQTDGFGLDTDQKRFIRLFFQPLLVIWALWSTGAWQALNAAVRRRNANS
ncbi:DoxX family protein [Arthrobacter sp. NPDC055585]